MLEERFDLVQDLEKVLLFKHQNILQFEAVDLRTSRNELVVITELITSGSLGEFIEKVKNF